ncbi:Beta-N-acetylglucosaminidase [Luteitalea pratensis]|uniref:Beta-N-acetylglucosaminidase n=1 Tax=Luteitalea pratensis TaxID=1855912 RepID=A0A143PS13_LUTPR|nr:beta-N-acetylhexosaminidase [Luteitalea pratensis]AMY10963.1 Beta-N-acetylglucosaminidase [Luteitalea pratensis]
MMQRDRRRHVGQLMLAGFRGHSIPVELRSLARDFDLGGVVLFARNVAEPAQVAELAREAAELSRSAPVWVAIDQEGGRVQRVKAPLTIWPAAAVLGRADDLDLTRRFARALARELRAMGITFDFAPVLDVLTRKDNPAIGDRSLSSDPAVVARHGVALVRALQQEGLPACAKHFPGHGDASVDSHEDLPVVDLSPDRLEHVEWVPFRAAIDAGIDAVMSGHLLVPSLDEHSAATLSPEVITGRLRGQLGFGGLVLTDDMDMKAISLRFEPGAAAARAIAAGCDGVLQCGGDLDRVHAALEGLVRAIEDETLPATRVDEALARHAELKARYLSEDARRRAPAAPTLRDVIGSAEHALVAEQMRQFA